MFNAPYCVGAKKLQLFSVSKMLHNWPLLASEDSLSSLPRPTCEEQANTQTITEINWQMDYNFINSYSYTNLQYVNNGFLQL